jgi:threonylcarbamoyladenosine tRNA methylthiotransferase MtaB
MDSMKFQMHTFGCKVNTYDSGLMQKKLHEGGFTSADKVLTGNPAPQGQIHVLNTCAVTAEATKEAVRLIRRLKSKDPLATVVVTGCGAQVDTGAFDSLPGADLVVANSHKSQLPTLLQDYFKGKLQGKTFKSNIFKKEELELDGGQEKEHTRSFLKIQDGCNSFCTYCVIPYARGKSRSIPMRELVKNIQGLYESGVQEVVLTGIHIGDYEDEVLGQKKYLEDLVEELLLKTKMPRFRISSLEPKELSDRLIQLYQDPRLCPHFHMSIQSANTETLTAMKRKYTRQDVMDALLKIQKNIPGAYVGMDVIVGFPTETEEQFAETYQTLNELPWTRLHVFPYSERSGTRAVQLGDMVSLAEKQSRARRLRELSTERFLSLLNQQVGSVKDVLILKKPSKGTHGLTRDYWPVFIEGLKTEDFMNKEVRVKIRAVVENERLSQEGHLVGEYAPSN